MKVRHFKIKDGEVVMCTDDYCQGEFIHINDIILLLKEKRHGKQALVDKYKDSEVDWEKRCHDMNEQCVYLINEILSEI